MNYGLDKVRFIAPVKAGARVRNRVWSCRHDKARRRSLLLTLRNTIEIDGEAKPALIAESLALLMGAPRVDTRNCHGHRTYDFARHRPVDRHAGEPRA